MGLFTRNSMNHIEMSELVTWLVTASLLEYQRSANWPGNQFRTDMANEWLAKTGHSASWWKLSKLAIVADNIARTVTVEDPSIPHVLAGGGESQKQDVRFGIFELVHGALLAGKHV